MSGAEAAPSGPSTQAAPTAAAPAAPPPPACENEFVQARLASVAALPTEQRSYDEAGFLRGHQLLAAAQESLAAIDGAPSEDERSQHLAVAALALLGGLEQLCSIGVPLKLALLLSCEDSLVALMERGTTVLYAAPTGSLDALLAQRVCVAHGFCGFADAFFQYTVALSLGSAAPEDRPPRDAWPNPAERLRSLRAQLFDPPSSQAVEESIALVRVSTAHHLPSLQQLQRLWAVFAHSWASELAMGEGQPAWMQQAGYPSPTRAEAQQLQLEALAAMRGLCPTHPLTDGMMAIARMAGLEAGPRVADCLRQGLQHAAALGGPHGGSLFTAKFGYGAITSTAPQAGTPPWGRLSLADSAQLLAQADAAMARCKALLPPSYLLYVTEARSSPFVRWRRTAVARHWQAGATEWRLELLAAEAAPALPRHAYVRQTMVRPACAWCGTCALELRACSACRLPEAKYCRCGGGAHRLLWVL